MTVSVTDHLLLVNQLWRLQQDYQPKKLVATTTEVFSIKLVAEVISQLAKALSFIKSKDRIIQVSGYRDYLCQKALYETTLVDRGKAFTEDYVALPGASEHQTGLAIDLGLNQDQIDEIAPAFEHAKISQLFTEIAPDFGFILRYPKGKEKITRIAYEPWHFRYVGQPHSQIMAYFDWTLEEYVAYLGQFKVKTQAFSWSSQEHDYLIWTIAESQLTEYLVGIDKEYSVALSRNNQQQIVVTCSKKKLIDGATDEY